MAQGTINISGSITGLPDGSINIAVAPITSSDAKGKKYEFTCPTQPNTAAQFFNGTLSAPNANPAGASAPMSIQGARALVITPLAGSGTLTLLGGTNNLADTNGSVLGAGSIVMTLGTAAVGTPAWWIRSSVANAKIEVTVL